MQFSHFILSLFVLALSTNTVAAYSCSSSSVRFSFSFSHLLFAPGLMTPRRFSHPHYGKTLMDSNSSYRPARDPALLGASILIAPALMYVHPFPSSRFNFFNAVKIKRLSWHRQGTKDCEIWSEGLFFFLHFFGLITYL